MSVRCIICHRKARLVTMPLIGRAYWLCGRHGSSLMLGVMYGLVAHG